MTKKIKGRFLWASSPDRGLHIVLKNWAKIRQIYDKATLHVAYGFDGWDKAIAQRNNPKEKAFRDSIFDGMKQKGVTHLGKISQKKLAEEWKETDILFFPRQSAWATHEIVCLEAMMGGAVVIATNQGALPTTIGSGGIIIEGDPESKDWQEKALAEVKRVLTDDKYAESWRQKGYKRVENCDWSDVAKTWKAEVFDKLQLNKEQTINSVEVKEKNGLPILEVSSPAIFPGIATIGYSALYELAKNKQSNILPAIKPKKTIVFYTGPSHKYWDGDTPAKEGIGMSETAVVKVAEGLAERGYDVKVFGNCYQRKVIRGVGWVCCLDFSGYISKNEPDVLIVERCPEILDGEALKAKIIIFAHQDEWYHGWEGKMWGNEDKVSVHIVRSEYHKHIMAEKHNLDLGKFRVIPNGVDFGVFGKKESDE